MTRVQTSNIRIILFILLIYLLCFQSPLEIVHSAFGTLDECVGLVVLGVIVVQALKNKKIIINKKICRMFLPVIVFLVVGIIGNIIYEYQPLKYVFIDIVANTKFYLAIGAGYVIFRGNEEERLTKPILFHVKVITLFLGLLFVVERITPVFGNTELRYGIQSAKMIYAHSTYLAGAIVFLLALLTYYYKKNNRFYIIINLCMLFFTMRGKAIGSVLVYILIIYFVVVFRKKINIWHIIIIGLSSIFIAWEQIKFYYIQLAGASARSVMTSTSFEILKDYFPIGTGFGTFGSHVAGTNYSPVYVKYGFEYVYELRRSSIGTFFDDTFWPIVIGQTGFIGLICYVLVIKNIYVELSKISKINKVKYASALFVMAYLMISSTSEPTFNNSISIPLAVMIGIMLREIYFKDNITIDKKETGA